MMSRIPLAWSIGVWAAITWGGRIAIVFDTGSDRADRARIALAIVTAALAVVALATDRVARPTVSLYAVVGSAIWIRSASSVIGGDGSIGFQAVHASLAVGSLALAAVAVLSVWRWH